jgi:hypothetical protein
MVHRGAEAGPVAVQTILNAVVHLCGHLHDASLSAKPVGKTARAELCSPRAGGTCGGWSQFAAGPEPTKTPGVYQAFACVTGRAVLRVTKCES